MDTWELYVNSYYRTSHIRITKVSLFWNFMLDLNFSICSKIPEIKLPNWKIKRDGEETTIREYYGDLSSLWHLFICLPIFYYCLKKQDEYLKKKNLEPVDIYLPYEFVKEKFKPFCDNDNVEDDMLFDEDEEISEVTKKYIESDHYEMKKFLSMQENIQNRIGDLGENS